MFFYLFQGAALALSATIMPGPFQAYLLSQALRQGWRRTLPAALAPLATDGPIITLVLFVLTQVPPTLLEILRTAGGLFLLYLSGSLALTLKKGDTAPHPGESAARRTFFQAVTMNFLNPNPYLWWSIIGGPIVLTGWKKSPAYGIVFLGGFYGVFILSLGVLIILFASAGRLDERVSKVLRIVAALALAGFGVYQVVSGLSSLLLV
ncbi:MAG: LysE family translocator [Deltaproteobacteria bacterium]|nr:LysE family translocator [Deltaproteobacteria bacterium]MBW2016482.1 LysE family translocator [Deltaproteobacteria bacterium]MBW2130282.1 LysE family translocator [Deltaproteobacteria bacterium]MBW2302303.1 LysE family translocator [Deltaproteobacteria bacterium]